jgi:hypothetical protein
MCQAVETEELEALVAGDLDTETETRLRAHLAGCATCRDELTWLSAEAELMARRRAQQPEVGDATWQGIVERLARPALPSDPPRALTEPVRVRRWGLGARVAYGSLLAAAAAAVLFATWPGQMTHNTPDLGRPSVVAHSGKPTTEMVLDRAEREYLDAAKVLEAEYAQERSQLPPSVAERYDAMLLKTKTRVADARVNAGSDVDGRMVVLDGYAEYLRSLQTIVTDIR